MNEVMLSANAAVVGDSYGEDRDGRGEKEKSEEGVSPQKVGAERVEHGGPVALAGDLLVVRPSSSANEDLDRHEVADKQMAKERHTRWRQPHVYEMFPTYGGGKAHEQTSWSWRLEQRFAENKARGTNPLRKFAPMCLWKWWEC